ncbi:ThuA domain-containing protein [candidate division KSB1 bacterium]|nr:ThuA domain-containing protein [candidate division KSB1 bacterium]
MQKIAFLLLIVQGIVLVVSGVLLEAGTAGPENRIYVNKRSRIPPGRNHHVFIVQNQIQSWMASQTAVIICDMWDKHWCRGAGRRVEELAPVIDNFAGEARRKGFLIIHSPSMVMDFYKDHPARLRAKNIKPAPDIPDGIDEWCQAISDEEKRNWPVDQSNGGCDCGSRCETEYIWTRQIESIAVEEDDFLSDSGSEIWSVLYHYGIQNIILVGVHTNMCVAGRPFGLRNLARFGKNVVLCRDLTDTMYDHRSFPYVSHFTGTDLVVEHIEKYICPTIISSDITDLPPFRFSEDIRPRVVILSAESEYEANRTLPDLAHELALNYNLSCELLQGSTDKEGAARNYIPGLLCLPDADLVVLFVRRRALPESDMDLFVKYLSQGKPLVALRTSSHAFNVKEELVPDLTEWENFDREVLGCRYSGYPHGETLVRIVPEAENHPILQGLTGLFRIRETIYKCNPLEPSCTVLLMGSCVDGDDENSRYHKDPGVETKDEPVAWTNFYGKSRIFYTSMGNGRASFKEAWFKRLLVQAMFWAMDLPIPEIIPGEKNAK